MSTEFLKTDDNMENESSENLGYENYRKLGGIINEADYSSALSRLEEAEDKGEVPDKDLDIQILRATNIAKRAGIQLDTQMGTDRRVSLYLILRNDARPKGIKDHHSSMTDEQIFVEALRILGDVDAIDKMITTHGKASFTWGEKKRSPDK